jgi:hypothetical protein
VKGQVRKRGIPKPPPREAKRGPKGYDWTPAFLTALGECGVMRYACEAAEVDRSTVYDRKKIDAVFAAKYKDATDQAADRLEQEAVRRAVDGWDEPVYQMGAQVGVVRKFDSGLLMFLLRAKKPEFKDKLQVDGNVSGGVHLTLDEFRDRLAEARERAGGATGETGGQSPGAGGEDTTDRTDGTEPGAGTDAPTTTEASVP